MSHKGLCKEKKQLLKGTRKKERLGFLEKSKAPRNKKGKRCRRKAQKTKMERDDLDRRVRGQEMYENPCRTPQTLEWSMHVSCMLLNPAFRIDCSMGF
eukprot:1160137-Pelagomonas_calceolata.AAC.19